MALTLASLPGVSTAAACTLRPARAKAISTRASSTNPGRAIARAAHARPKGPGTWQLVQLNWQMAGLVENLPFVDN